MSDGKAFFDTSVLLYLLSEDARKADRVEALLAKGGVISVQVLNEFASVCSRKLKLPWSDVRAILDTVRAVTEVAPLTTDLHDRALDLAEQYRFSFYDCLIVASALEEACSILYCEDLQSGQRIERTLRIVNPFA